jgi:hypothetical protein
MINTLPSWRQVCKPHRDIREDAVSEALFAVNLSRAIAHEGPAEYRDPTLFFERTHLTRTLQSIVRDVLTTLGGEPGASTAQTSVIHLQTNFGGGKTHAELALYHLLTSPEAALAVPHVAEFLRANDIKTIPQAAVAALPCADLDAGGREVGGHAIRTLWGELAYRLGGAARGAELYAILADSDQGQRAPGVAKLRRLLTAAGPNLILIDELLHYVDKAAAVRVGDSNLATQTLAFLRELTEAVDAAPASMLVASLTMSKLEELQVLTEDQATFTLAQLEDILRRLENTCSPIEGAEIYDIVRTRLFQEVDASAAADTAAAYADFYRSEQWRDLLPQVTREADYELLLGKAYPFHPSIVKVLYERWGSRPQFQLTRGTLRFLSHLLAHLWKTGATHLGSALHLIHLADVDLADEDVRGETIRVAGSAWEAVIGADIATTEPGDPALAARADQERGGLYTRLGLVQGVATSVFLFTHGGEQRKPTPQSDVRLAVARPHLPLSDLNQAFDDARARLYYYYDEEGGLIFKTEPNPNKVLADERANVTTDQARRLVEGVVPEVLGGSQLFHVSYYDFHSADLAGIDGRALANVPGDVPDDDTLQLVILPPHLSLAQGKLVGRTREQVRDIAANYGKKHRMGRNLVCFLTPASRQINLAVDRAVDWAAARRVQDDAGLMARFSETQQQTIADRVRQGENGAKDFVRKAYNTLLLPASRDTHELFELNYVPPSKTVLSQAEDELLQSRKIHQQFNPALLEGRWAELWPKTATVITTEKLWQKFARRGEAPILAGQHVFCAMVERGVEQEIFGYGMLRSDRDEILQAQSYDRVFFGPTDAGDLRVVEIGPRGVLLRPAQVNALFPPITPDEVAMLLSDPRQQVSDVFRAARTSPLVEGRVNQEAFFVAICEGVQAGLFGYAEHAQGAMVRGPQAALTPGDVRFSGWLIGESVPLPVTAEEVVRLAPSEGRIAVQELLDRAAATYGAERVTAEHMMDLLAHAIREGRFGYAADADTLIQTGISAIAPEGYIGAPETPPPDTRLIHLRGAIGQTELVNVIQMAMKLGSLSQEPTTITLEMSIALKGEVNEHAVKNALRDIQKRVAGLVVEDVRGK